MNWVAQSDFDFVSRHRTIWAARQELRSVYYEWFSQLLRCVDGLRPIVEVGSGPGFFKEHSPRLISTDLIPNPWVDVVCDAGKLPFHPATVGALVMVDVLHHLPKPLEFMTEACRVLQPGGRLAMIEPWVTPLSFLLYRYIHHEDCSLRVDLDHPFDEANKKAFDGNAAIPFKLVKRHRDGIKPLSLVLAHSFVGLPYLVTFGFRLSRPIPSSWIKLARVCERMTGPLSKWAATRVLIVWEKSSGTVQSEEA